MVRTVVPSFVLYLHFVSAPSTQLILGGKSPALYCAPLQGNRLKQDLIRERKKDVYPHGQGIPGM